MGYAVLLIVAFFLAIAGLVFAVVAAIVLAVGKWSTPRRRKLWIGLPFLLGVLPITLMFAKVMAASVSNSIRPASWAYEEVFGTSPVAQSELKAATSSGFDSRRIFLAVDRTAEASAQISQHIAERATVPNSDMADSIALNGDAPDWWRAGRSWVEQKGCADVVQSHFVDVGEWTNLIIADCPSQQRIFVLALR